MIEEIKNLKRTNDPRFNLRKGITFASTVNDLQGKTDKCIHTFEDLSMVLREKTIGSPDIFSYQVEIPGRDGLLDLTELYYKKPTYKNRMHGAIFTTDRADTDWSNIYSRVADRLHGRKVYFTFDEDPEWYYTGRVMIDRFETNKARATIGLKMDCEPYKTELNPQNAIYTDENGRYRNAWLWDPFDFRTGIINPNVWQDLTGEIEIQITNRHRRVQPYFRTPGEVEIEQDGNVFTLKSTLNSEDNSHHWKKVDGLWFDEGVNTIKVRPKSAPLSWFRCAVIGGML